MVWCDGCFQHVTGSRPFDGSLACDVCGKVLEESNFSLDPTFVKNAAGQSQFAGNITRSRQSQISASRERTLKNSRAEMMTMKNGLGIGSDRDDVVDMANRLYGIAVERNFTKGRRSEQVQAACLYFSCRENNIPILIIDFSSYLTISVYELGAVYLKLCETLYITASMSFDKLVDPSIFIPKFTYGLLPRGNKENKAVIKTTRDIIASMKRDWMQTGRKPSGICGAALYISAISHGLKFSKTEIVKVVHICEATLTKRLLEFENTESGSLTVEELQEREDLHKESVSKRPMVDGKDVVLCRHQGKIPFGYGLCASCYEDFMTVSGGLVGGSDPPAFQQAEKERIARESTEDISNGNSMNRLSRQSENEVSIPSVSRKEKLHSVESNGQEGGNDKSRGLDGGTDASDNFSDIDDDEVDGYLLLEEEKHYKKTIWEELNREYIEEQAAKEADLAAAKEALKAKYANCAPHDIEAAQKLAKATAELVIKARKEKQKKRAAEAKNVPQTAAEATRQMLSKKRISSKINYDALEKLFETPQVKKQKSDSLSDNNDEKDNNAGTNNQVNDDHLGKKEEYNDADANNQVNDDHLGKEEEEEEYNDEDAHAEEEYPDYMGEAYFYDEDCW